MTTNNKEISWTNKNTSWYEYFVSMLQYANPVTAYLNAKEDGQPFEGEKFEVEFQRDLGMFHTYCAELMGISRTEFAIQVAMTGNKGPFFVVRNDNDEKSLLIDKETILCVTESKCEQAAERVSDSLEKELLSQWEMMPLPFPYEDILERSKKVVWQGGSTHMKIVFGAYIINSNIIPALMDTKSF